MCFCEATYKSNEVKEITGPFKDIFPSKSFNTEEPLERHRLPGKISLGPWREGRVIWHSACALSCQVRLSGSPRCAEHSLHFNKIPGPSALDALFKPTKTPGNKRVTTEVNSIELVEDDSKMDVFFKLEERNLSAFITNKWYMFEEVNMFTLT